MARNDFGQLQDSLAEGGSLVVVMPFHLDADKYGQAEPHLFACELRMVARDYAGVLQHPHPAQAGRGREADLVGEFHIGQPGIPLQGYEDPAIDGIQFQSWHVVLIPDAKMASSANHGPYHAITRKDMPRQGRLCPGSSNIEP